MGVETDSRDDAVALFTTLGLDDALRDAPARETIRRELAFADTAHAATTEPDTADSDPVDVGLPTAEALDEALAALPHVAIDDAGDEGGADLSVTGTLGEGGMGVVQRVEQRSLTREVAVKRIRHAGASVRSVHALLVEARITGALEHPNIVPIHALGRDQHGDPALVMKRVEGVPWLQLIRDGAHPRWQDLGEDRLRVHLETLMQVCRAVELAHSRSVLHRDLKPENVMIGRFGEVYVLDWGIALVLEGESARSGVVGTPAYMAPEMAAGGPLTRRTDGYLLGAVLHEVLTGRPPHDGDTMLETLASIVRADPPKLPPETPSELATICARALSRDPDERFDGVGEFRRALATFLAHKESSALTDEALRRLASLDEASEARREALSEIQFVFRQALQVWDGNEPAQRGLAAANGEIVRLELAAGSVDAARALMASYDAPEELRAALAEAEAGALREQARVAQLESVAAEHDVGSFWRKRRRRIFVAATGLTVLPLIAWGPVFLSASGPTYTHVMFGSSVFFALGVLALVGLVRRPELQLRRKVVAGLAPPHLLMLPLVIVGSHAGLDPGLVTGIATVLFGAAMFVTAALVHPVFWAPSVVLTIAGVVGMLHPEHAVTATVVGDLVSVPIGLAIVLRRPVQEPEAEGPAPT